MVKPTRLRLVGKLGWQFGRFKATTLNFGYICVIACERFGSTQTTPLAMRTTNAPSSFRSMFVNPEPP